MPGGVNFSLFARDAERLALCLFAHQDDAEPSAVLPFEGEAHRTGHYWHGFVAGLAPGQLYGFLAIGPRAGADLLLLDPYALAVAMPDGYSRQQGQRRDGACGWAQAMKGVVADLSSYDWQGDQPLRRPARDAVIYELHVRGFTADPSSGVPPPKAGTFSGLIEKIPYLQQLGVTAVELLPVFQFDPQAAWRGEPWHRWIDTALPSPNDIVPWEQAPPLAEPTVVVQPRSVVALVVGHLAGL